jgi:hypothetical protein
MPDTVASRKRLIARYRHLRQNPQRDLKRAGCISTTFGGARIGLGRHAAQNQTSNVCRIRPSMHAMIRHD